MMRFWFRGPARKGPSGQGLPLPPRPGPRRRVLLRLEAVEDRTVTSTVTADPPHTTDSGVVADQPPDTTPTDPGLLDHQPGDVPAPETLAGDATGSLTSGAADIPPPTLSHIDGPGLKVADGSSGVHGSLNVFAGAPGSPAFEMDQADLTVRPGPTSGTAQPDDVGPTTKASGPAKPTAGPTADSITATTAVALATPTAAPTISPDARGASTTTTAPTDSARPADGTAVIPTAVSRKAAASSASVSPNAIVAPESKRTPQSSSAASAGVRATVDRLPSDLTDGALLHRFVADKDQAAFTALVQRHGSMVLGVARRVLGDWTAAQDAFQATFLVLARKAALLDRDSPLGGWLYKVAYHLALRSRAVAARQKQTERDAADETPVAASDSPGDDVEQRELRQVIREELDRLPEKYREPLILCYIDGRTHADAAAQIGLPRGSMAKRIGEGLERLRERLLDRGFMM
jgi:RNA polymerase sigma factor (sigma-70 family)